MNEVLRPFIDSFISVYLNYIVVSSYTWEDHFIHLRKLLQTLHDANLYLKRSKFYFGKKYLVCLGHIVGGG